MLLFQNTNCIELVKQKMIKRTVKNIKRNKINEENQRIYNHINPSGLSRNTGYSSRVISNKLSLEHPEVMMNNEYFFNPYIMNYMTIQLV